MKVLIACEESQRVTMEFRRLGHEAYSCDIIECSGGHPEWHIKQDVLPLINGDCIFTTCDGLKHRIQGKWDLLIAHPPCTYLSNAATQCHSLKCYSLEQINNRMKKRIEAITFFMEFINADCDKIAIENPIGIMNTIYRKPDCVIHPWYFAKNENDIENYQTKKTQFWLKGLEPLHYDLTRIKPKINNDTWDGNGKRKNWTESNHGSKNRSKTFPGIAKAMAEQWGGKL